MIFHWQCCSECNSLTCTNLASFLFKLHYFRLVHTLSKRLVSKLVVSETVCQQKVQWAYQSCAVVMHKTSVLDLNLALCREPNGLSGTCRLVSQPVAMLERSSPAASWPSHLHQHRQTILGNSSFQQQFWLTVCHCYSVHLLCFLRFRHCTHFRDSFCLASVF